MGNVIEGLGPTASRVNEREMSYFYSSVFVSSQNEGILRFFW
jgi:hypothetical protein